MVPMIFSFGRARWESPNCQFTSTGLSCGYNAFESCLSERCRVSFGKHSHMHPILYSLWNRPHESRQINIFILDSIEVCFRVVPCYFHDYAKRSLWVVSTLKLGKRKVDKTGIPSGESATGVECYSMVKVWFDCIREMHRPNDFSRLVVGSREMIVVWQSDDWNDFPLPQAALSYNNQGMSVNLGVGVGRRRLTRTASIDNTPLSAFRYRQHTHTSRLRTLSTVEGTRGNTRMQRECVRFYEGDVWGPERRGYRPFSGDLKW